MPSIGALLKQEIARLSRREIRNNVQPIQKASANYRRDIAAVKRQVATLERQVALMQRRGLGKPPADTTSAVTTKVRFAERVNDFETPGYIYLVSKGAVAECWRSPLWAG